MSDGYTAAPVQRVCTEYLSVNVYRTSDGWYVVRRIMVPGGVTARVVRRFSPVRVASPSATLTAAIAAAADALGQMGDDPLF